MMKEKNFGKKLQKGKIIVLDCVTEENQVINKLNDKTDYFDLNPISNP